jgi:hypothetical protein
VVLIEHAQDEQPYVFGRMRVVHPREPSAQTFPVTVHERVERFGVAGFEHLDFDSGRHVAAEHHSSTTANARTGNVPKPRTFTGTA